MRDLLSYIARVQAPSDRHAYVGDPNYVKVPLRVAESRVRRYTALPDPQHTAALASARRASSSAVCRVQRHRPVRP